MYPHVHKYKFESASENNHSHRMSGYTENAIGLLPIHFHYFYGVTSYNNHTHYYSGITGLPIKTENGHIHKLEGIMEVNNAHGHDYINYTLEDVEYISGKKYTKAYI